MVVKRKLGPELTQLRAFLRPQGTTGLGDMIHVVSIMSWTSSFAV